MAHGSTHKGAGYASPAQVPDMPALQGAASRRCSRRRCRTSDAPVAPARQLRVAGREDLLRAGWRARASTIS